MSDTRPNPRLVFRLHARARIVSSFLLLVLITAGSVSAQQNPPATSASARIVWSKQAGVTNYRLQIATDPKFNDVIIDRRVSGYDYVVRDLAPGRYYWRVAAAETQTGEFLSGVPFEVRIEKPSLPQPTPAFPSTVPTTDTTVRTRRTVPGWSVASGDVVNLLSARLRPGATSDFIGVNSDGTVYALQGSRGVALWTAHFHFNSSGAKRVRDHYQQFTPLVVNIGGLPAVIVAFDEGTRALDGATGREIWNTKMGGRPFLGATMERPGSTPLILLVGEQTNKLLIIDSKTGQLINQLSLRDEIVHAPLAISSGEAAQLLVPLKGGLLEVHTLDGKYVKSIRVATEITTQLQVVSTTRGKFVLVGLKNGLIALDAASLQGVGRIALEGNDYPIGLLSLVDLDGDRVSEVVMSTRAGRVLAVDVSDGKIKWSTEPGSAQGSLSFVDIDGDAHPDVILPGSKNFAVGLSGMNGSVIWQSGDESTPTSSSRALAVAQLADGRIVIVGSDRSASGLRALEVNKASAKVNQ